MSLVSETVQPEQYCICRGSYGNKFMIECDGCDEWFHGSCISINSDQAKTVDQYFCPFCVEKDPSLKTIYKATPKDRQRDKHKEKHKGENKEKHKGENKEKTKRKEKKSRRDVFDSGDSDDAKKKEKRKSDVLKVGFVKKSKEETKHRTHKEETKQKLVKEEVKAKAEVKGIRDEVAKHKLPKEESHYKVKMMELKLEDSVKTKSVKDQAEPAKMKEEKFKKMLPVYSDDLAKKKEKKKEDFREKKEDPVTAKKPPTPVRTDSDEDDFNSFLSTLAGAKRAPAVSSSEDEEVDVGVDEVVVQDVKRVNKSSVKDPPTKQEKKKVTRKKGRPKKHTGSQKHPDGGANEQVSSEEEEKQCIGPGCCAAARSRSRYCSDECGILLATKRIETFLPERKEDMKRGGVARRFDEEMIRNLEKQQEAAHKKIDELQNQRLVVMKLIEKAKSATHEEKGSDEDMSDEEGENEGIDCVTCGMACTDKSAVRHMERCYNKYESKLGLGSTVKCHVTWESPVCDAYDRQQGTYCKKLKVLCPDHNKEKEEHDGICGCPLDVNIISEDGEVCLRAKRRCNKHHSWEKLRLAEIDMERVLLDLKLEDSFEEMRKVKYRMLNRTNLLQILLNGTIRHAEQRIS